MKKIIPLLAILSLSACATATGPAYNPQNTLKSNTSQIIIYRNSAFSGSAVSPKVSLNDSSVCKVPMKGFTVHDVKPGKSSLFVDGWADTKFTVDVNKGEKKFVRVSANNARSMAGGTAGIIGLFAYGAATHGQENTGDWRFDVISKEIAENEMAEAKQIDCK
jgi:hypothetical protein